MARLATRPAGVRHRTSLVLPVVLVSALGLAFAPIGLLINPALAQQAAQPSPDRPGFTWSGLRPPFDTGIDAVLPLEGGALLFRGDQFAVYATGRSIVVQQDTVRTLRGFPESWSQVSAAAAWDGSQALLFSGSEFAWMDLQTFTFVAAPQPVSTWAGWPWGNGPGAAVRIAPGYFLFLNGNQFVTYQTDPATGGGQFSGVGNLSTWPGWPAAWVDGVHGAVGGGDGAVYFFRDSYYGRYEPRSQVFDPLRPFGGGAASGAPTQHAGAAGAYAPQQTTPAESSGGLTWGCLAPPFDSGVDAAAPIGGGAVLVFAGDQVGICDTVRHVMVQNGPMRSLPGFPQGWSGIEAAAIWSEQTALVFGRGGPEPEFAMLNLSDYSFSNLSPLRSWSDWPFEAAPDAAVQTGPGAWLFFYRNLYVQYSLDPTNGEPQFSQVGDVRDWDGWPQAWAAGPPTAVNGLDDALYFMGGTQFLRFDMATRQMSPLMAFGGVEAQAAAAPEQGYQPTPAPGQQVQQEAAPQQGQYAPVQAAQASGDPARMGIAAPEARQAYQALPSAPGQQPQQQAAAQQRQDAPTQAPPAGAEAPPAVEQRLAGVAEPLVSGEQSFADAEQPSTAPAAEEGSGFVGGQGGTPFSDDPPADSTLFALIVRAGAYVDSVQALFVTPGGEIVRQPIHGGSGGNGQTFQIGDAERLLRVTGTSVAPGEPFIHSIQFHTNQQSSPVYGDPRTGEPFELVVGPGSQFAGFAGRAGVYLDAIGILEAEDLNPVSTYRDDYVDYVAETGGGLPYVPAYDYLGDGYNVVFGDPTKFGENDPKFRKQSAIVLTRGGPETAAPTGDLMPVGVRYSSGGAGSSTQGQDVITSLQAFRSNFDSSFGANVGVAGVASFSASGTFGRINSSKTGSEQIFIYQKDVVSVHALDLDLTWKDPTTDELFRQKLNPDFRRRVAGLPDTQACAPYDEILNIYGTHYASRVTYGGRFNVLTTINKDVYESSSEDSRSFQASASATVKKVSFGAEGGFSQSTGSDRFQESLKESTEIWSSGGRGSKDYETWVSQVELNPAPAHMVFEDYSTLFTPAFFPNDPSIAAKSARMKSCTEEYVKRISAPYMADNTNKSGDFFKRSPRKFRMRATYMLCNGEAQNEPGRSEFYGMLNIGAYQGDGTALIAVPFWIRPGGGEDDCEASVCLDANSSHAFAFGWLETAPIAPENLSEAYVKVSGFVKEGENWPYGPADVGQEDQRGTQGRVLLDSITKDRPGKGSVTLTGKGGDSLTIHYEVERLQ